VILLSVLPLLGFVGGFENIFLIHSILEKYPSLISSKKYQVTPEAIITPVIINIDL
jgi:hypothetical protein